MRHIFISNTQGRKPQIVKIQNDRIFGGVIYSNIGPTLAHNKRFLLLLPKIKCCNPCTPGSTDPVKGLDIIDFITGKLSHDPTYVLSNDSFELCGLAKVLSTLDYRIAVGYQINVDLGFFQGIEIRFVVPAPFMLNTLLQTANI